MIYIDSFILPSDDDIDRYPFSVYPFSLFFENQFRYVSCKDITIFYGNNGSGKSTIMNLLTEKISGQRSSELFKDVIYSDQGGAAYTPFDDFVKKIAVKMALDDNGSKYVLPSVRKLITSDDIFKRIDERAKHNRKAIIEIEEQRAKRRDVLNKGYTFKSSEDYEDLKALIEARSKSARQYAKDHARKKELMQSNGETALEIFERSFESGGIYFLDEPENCLSPLFQVELIKLIQDAVRLDKCQFFICTHSPLLLSLSNAIIYNLDHVPVTVDKWEDLENVKIYHDFFKKKKDLFK